MNIKTSELQQLQSILGTDSLLADTAAAGTGRVATAALAQFMDQELLKPGTALSAALSNKVSKTTRSDIYEAKAGSDETGDGSEAAPYLTIQKAVNSIRPGRTLDVPIRLHIDAGTYDEAVLIASIAGCRLSIICAQNGDGTPAVHVKSVAIFYCDSPIYISNMEVYAQTIDRSAIFISGCTLVDLYKVVCKTEVVNAENNRGAIFSTFTPSVYLRICTISNQSCAVHAIGSIVYLDAGTTGENNTISLRAGSGDGSAGAIIFKGSSTIAGATEIKEYGGQIF